MFPFVWSIEEINFLFSTIKNVDEKIENDLSHNNIVAFIHCREFSVHQENVHTKAMDGQWLFVIQVLSNKKRNVETLQA